MINRCNICGTTEDLVTQKISNQFMKEPILKTLSICKSCKSKGCSAANKGKPKTKEHIEKMREINIGKKATQETKDKMSLTRKGKQFSEKHRANIGKAHKGKVISEDHKETLRMFHTGLRHTDEAKQKMSIARIGEKNHFFGKHHTIESKEKISDSVKATFKKEEWQAFFKKNKFKSKSEKYIFSIVKEIHPLATNFSSITTKETTRYPDILIPNLDLIIEFDGSYYHDPIKDKQRDLELISEGFKIIHYVDYIPTLLEIEGDIKTLMYGVFPYLYRIGDINSYRHHPIFKIKGEVLYNGSSGY